MCDDAVSVSSASMCVCVCCVDSADVHQVLTTIVHGAVELTDPVTQKLCFAVLRKLVELWGG